MKSMLVFSRMIFVVLSFVVLLLSGCGGGGGDGSTPSVSFTADNVAGKTFTYASSTDSTGTFAFNTDRTWNINIDELDLSGDWSINEEGKLVCVTTSGGDFTLTYTLISTTENTFDTDVEQVNPADPDNPENYTATLTPVFTSDQVAGKTFAYASSTGSTGTFTFNTDNMWDISIDELDLSGDWSINDEGKLVCVTTYGGDFTLTYTALVSDDANAIHASVVQVNPADPTNPANYTATLTAINTISGKIDPMYGIFDVTMTLDGDQTLTVTTDAYGNYSFTVPNGEYRITPTKTNRLFTPLDTVLNVNNASISDVDFMLAPFEATQSPNTWKVNGSLTYRRFNHTATLLKDGSVLVAGGMTNLIPLARASAELYDPDEVKWTATGSMTYDRQSHTATLLDDGKVLVAGGQSKKSTARASAELYDPDTKKWTTTGSMTYARSQHSMTLLDKKVLVVGGVGNYGNFPAIAEIYDPVTKKWLTTDPMTYERYWHTATLLKDGRVLVVGGIGKNYTAASASAEIYDPATKKWSTTGSMAYARFDHAITLLQDGRVLVAGGRNYKPSYDNTLASAEIYDPETRKWTTIDSMTYERCDFAMTLLDDGRVLVTGGYTKNAHVRASAEIYDPATRKWSTTGSMADDRSEHSMTLLKDGKVLVAGGITIFFTRASTEVFRPDSN